MFTFSIQQDTIRVEARDFGKDPAVAIAEEIGRRYVNKILPDVGLCIALLDIIDTCEGAVLFGDGCLYYKTQFRLVIFRPFIGEAIVGKVQSQSEAGLVVSLNFMSSILVPPNLLPDYSVFDTARRSYFWVYPPDPLPETRPSVAQLLQTPEEDRLYIQKKDWVRVRVEQEKWTDGTAGKKSGFVAITNGADVEEQTEPLYSLICSMTEAGTGVLEWWDQGEADGEDGMEL